MATLLEKMPLPPHQSLTMYKSLGRDGALWALSPPRQGVFNRPSAVQIITSCLKLLLHIHFILKKDWCNKCLLLKLNFERKKSQLIWVQDWDSHVMPGSQHSNFLPSLFLALCSFCCPLLKSLCILDTNYLLDISSWKRFSPSLWVVSSPN